MEFRDELEAAKTIARAAGEIVFRFYENGAKVERKADGTHVTEADLAANEYITRELLAQFSYPILSEETKDDALRLGAERIWVVDPVDGTQDFVNKTGYFGVSIGLAVHGRAVVGAVHHPPTGRLYYAAQGIGAFMEANGVTTKLAVSDRSRTEELNFVASSMSTRIQAWAESLGVARKRGIGSVVMKGTSIAEGENDLYVARLAHQWDSCAVEVVVAEAGGKMTDILGEPFIYNGTEVAWTKGIYCTNGKVSEEVREAARRLYGL